MLQAREEIQASGKVMNKEHRLMAGINRSDLQICMQTRTPCPRLHFEMEAPRKGTRKSLESVDLCPINHPTFNKACAIAAGDISRSITSSVLTCAIIGSQRSIPGTTNQTLPGFGVEDLFTLSPKCLYIKVSMYLLLSFSSGKPRLPAAWRDHGDYCCNVLMPETS